MLSFSHTHTRPWATIRAENETSDVHKPEKKRKAGWVRERCVYSCWFGKMCLMMEISLLNSPCAKHIHHPDNGGKANRSARGVLPCLPKGKTLYAMRVRLHPGAILQKWRVKLFLLSSFDFFGEDKWPTSGKFGFMFVFLGWTSWPLWCLTGFYNSSCQHELEKATQCIFLMSFGSHGLSLQWTFSKTTTASLVSSCYDSTYAPRITFRSVCIITQGQLSRQSGLKRCNVG